MNEKRERQQRRQIKTGDILMSIQIQCKGNLYSIWDPFSSWVGMKWLSNEMSISLHHKKHPIKTRI
jgi:hypothetical protein